MQFFLPSNFNQFSSMWTKLILSISSDKNLLLEPLMCLCLLLAVNLDLALSLIGLRFENPQYCKNF